MTSRMREKQMTNRVTAEQLKKLQVSDKETAVISSKDLDRMRSSLGLGSNKGGFEAEEDGNLRRERELEESRQRKERLREKEALAKSRAPKSDLAIEAEVKADEVRLHAAKQAVESIDEVKKMNSMMLYAKCVTIRDAQLREKAMLAEREKEEERRLAEMMERDRLAALAREEDKERRRREESRASAGLIVNQIAEIEERRTLEERERERERAEVLAHMAKLQEEERAKLERKRAEASRLMEEVRRGNDEQVKLKHERARQAKEEERMIEEYMERLRLEKEEFEREKEERMRQKERQKEIIMERQEQAIVKLAARDELIARRAMEAKEREWRENQRREAEKREKARVELDESRQEQIRQKKIRLALQAKKDQANFVAISQEQLRQQARDEEAKKVFVERKQRIADELKVQVAEVEEAKRKKYRDKFSEGEKLKAQQAKELRELERIKAEKVRELIDSGVPAKYVSELERKKIQ